MLKYYNAQLNALSPHAKRKVWIDGKLEALYGELKDMERECDSLRGKCNAVQEERESIRPQAGEFRRVLVQKRAAMRQLGLFTGEMLSLEQARQDMDKRIRHLTRTIESGDRIMDLMREISNNVNEAINQGQSDLFGCKTYEWGSGYAKHWKLSDAQKRFDRLQQMIENGRRKA